MSSLPAAASSSVAAYPAGGSAQDPAATRRGPTCLPPEAYEKPVKSWRLISGPNFAASAYDGGSPIHIGGAIKFRLPVLNKLAHIINRRHSRNVAPVGGFCQNQR